MPRTWIFWSISVALVLTAMEGLSLLSLHLIERARPGIVLDLFLHDHFDNMTSEDIERFRTKGFDRALGWNNRPLSLFEGVNSAGQSYRVRYAADGAREDGLTRPKPLVMTYGDSFTAGDEVNDDETWPFFLQSLLNDDVRNFGTDGYGTDQAVLKFEQHARSNALAPIVVLGVMSDDIDRIVSIFRPFLLPQTGFKLGFKPRYRCVQSGAVVVIPNPLQVFKNTADELHALATQAAQSDPYAKSKLRLSWPFTSRMIKFFYEYGLSRLGRNSLLFAHSESFNLWADQNTSHLMQCILERFVVVARAHGSVPILLFIPRRGHALRPPYQDFVARLQESLTDVTVIDIAKEPFDPRRFYIRPQGGHPSRYGNQIIARAVYGAIELEINPQRQKTLTENHIPANIKQRMEGEDGEGTEE